MPGRGRGCGGAGEGGRGRSGGIYVQRARARAVAASDNLLPAGDSAASIADNWCSPNVSDRWPKPKTYGTRPVRPAWQQLHVAHARAGREDVRSWVWERGGRRGGGGRWGGEMGGQAARCARAPRPMPVPVITPGSGSNRYSRFARVAVPSPLPPVMCWVHQAHRGRPSARWGSRTAWPPCAPRKWGRRGACGAPSISSAPRAPLATPA